MYVRKSDFDSFNDVKRQICDRSRFHKLQNLDLIVLNQISILEIYGRVVTLLLNPKAQFTFELKITVKEACTTSEAVKTHFHKKKIQSLKKRSFKKNSITYLYNTKDTHRKHHAVHLTIFATLTAIPGSWGTF